MEVFEARPGSTPRERLTPAVLSVEDSALVLAQRGGVLVKLSTDVGAGVEEGQILAELAADDLRAQIRQLEFEAESSRLNERQLEALVEVNRSELDQETELFQEGLTSKRLLDRARYKLEATEHELGKTRLATRATLAKVEASKVELEKTQIRAPISGVVARRFVTRGTTVTKDARLFEISRLRPLQVAFQLEQKDRGLLGPGSMVRVSLADNPRVVALARVRRVDPTADAQSNTLGLLADLIEPEGFLPGVAVNVHVPGVGLEADLWIPRAAFPPSPPLEASKLSRVLVVEGDRCSSRSVLLGEVRQREVAVRSGLVLGDRVIVQPPDSLRPGDSVTPRTR